MFQINLIQQNKGIILCNSAKLVTNLIIQCLQADLGLKLNPAATLPALKLIFSTTSQAVCLKRGKMCNIIFIFSVKKKTICFDIKI